MLIIKKLGKIKTRHIGFVSDIYNDHLDVMTTKPRVFSDEIPLPDVSFCMSRANSFNFIPWFRLACKILENKNSSQSI